MGWEQIIKGSSEWTTYPNHVNAQLNIVNMNEFIYYQPQQSTQQYKIHKKSNNDGWQENVNSKHRSRVRKRPSSEGTDKTKNDEPKQPKQSKRKSVPVVAKEVEELIAGEDANDQLNVPMKKKTQKQKKKKKNAPVNEPVMAPSDEEDKSQADEENDETMAVIITLILIGVSIILSM